MPQLSALPINLNESEQSALEKLLRRSSTAQQIAMRAKIILRAAAGESHGEISRGLGITKDTSRLWRNRWLKLKDSKLSVEARLEDAARSGTPAPSP
jgi:putative transposase